MTRVLQTRSTTLTEQRKAQSTRLSHLRMQASFALRKAEQVVRRLEALLHAVDELEAETFWFSAEDLGLRPKPRRGFQPIRWSGFKHAS